MKFSQQFFSNSFFEQDNAKLELTDLARKACFFHQDAAGLYSWMSLSLRASGRFEWMDRRTPACESVSAEDLAGHCARRR
ncbi:hypothetical protein WJ32_27285 [Burkholderia ubonensis]|uniref:Uncharacterized protein n=1 Tax=Burkholderia ubonensis TaxID=101571 RepID=A0A103RPV5_9BURK|nr:hypothetical protein [Burkholderia ubonensis]AOJ66106.1 hypothetical protein WJ32_27285 [Burkholderia ubonensis]KVG71652.1 hypothetical protein WJ33_21115 [Burkholderia ubonensis]